MAELGPQADAINAVRRPLRVYDHDRMHWDIGVAMLAMVLRTDVRVQLFDRLGSVRVDDPGSGFFLYGATAPTKAAVEAATNVRWSPVQEELFGSGLVYELRAMHEPAKSAKK
jgi:hypothetical protein